MLVENTLFANRYRLEKRLGEGAFSVVWKATDTKAGNLNVALKIYAPEKGLDENGTKTFSEEFALVFNMSHQNLLTPTYFDDYNGSPYLVLPFCEKGSAMNMVGMSNEDQVLHFMHDVSSALAYLHENGVIHQDIKPDNVLIDSTGCYKVTDFGISTKMRSTLRRSVGDKKGAGTMAYMGPERFSRNPETIKASDIWSLGATVYELMTGDVPFGDIGGGMQKGGAEIPEIQGDFPAKMKELVERCLAKETWDRPTADQIREVCDIRIRQGYWDLSPLKQAGTSGGGESSGTGGRPTTRRVDIPVQEPEKKTSEHKQDIRKNNVETDKDRAKKGKVGIVVGVLLGLVAVFYVVKALVPSEKRDWNKIQYSGTYLEYYKFSKKYPDGDYANQAREKMVNQAVSEQCIDCLKEIVAEFAGYSAGVDAKGLMMQVEKSKLEEVVGETDTYLETFGNTWQDFGDVIRELNVSWDKLNSLQNEVESLREFVSDGSQCSEISNTIESKKTQMKTQVKQKIDALQQNIALGSTSEVQYVNEMKEFKGL